MLATIASLTPEFQSTLPAKGATAHTVLPYAQFGVSIHAPREGSDPTKLGPTAGFCKFQSTLPAKGATMAARRCVY